MLIFTNKIPEKPLDDYVSGIVYYRDYDVDHDMEKFFPDGTTNLVIDLKDSPKYIFDNKSHRKLQTCTEAWYSGMHTEYLTISSGVNSEMIVITFKAGRSYTFLKSPLHHFNNKVVPAKDIFGEEISNLRMQLLGPADGDTKISKVEQWMNQRLETISFAEKVIQQLVDQIRYEPDSIDIKQIADRSGYSQKQFIHLFKKFVGPTPKIFHRIVRFNEILHAVHQKKKVDWIGVAQSCGYFDQAHFIKDFQSFSGLNPQKYIQDQGEWPHYVPVR